MSKARNANLLNDDLFIVVIKKFSVPLGNQVDIFLMLKLTILQYFYFSQPSDKFSILLTLENFNKFKFETVN